MSHPTQYAPNLNPAGGSPDYSYLDTQGEVAPFVEGDNYITDTQDSDPYAVPRLGEEDGLVKGRDGYWHVDGGRGHVSEADLHAETGDFRPDHHGAHRAETNGFPAAADAGVVAVQGLHGVYRSRYTNGGARHMA